MGVRLSTLVRRVRRESPSGGASSDADLLARFAHAGDHAAFELLVWRHGSMVLAACQRALAQAEDAEDAFQAVFLVLARKAGSVSRGTALPAWLHRVAVRVATRHARSRRRIAPLPADVPAEPGPDAAVRAETFGALDEEIDRLPERCRRAVVLCYLNGLTAAEAAQRLGCPTGTVESRLASARKRLRDRLTRRGITLPAGVLAGSAILAPEAVARVARAGVMFARGGAGMGVISEESVRLAKGVLAMWRTRVWTTLLGAVTLAALTATAGFGWSDEPQPQPAAPPVTVAEAPKPEPKPAPEPDAAPPDTKPAEPDANVWGGAPVWVASTVAPLYDISPDGKRFLYADGRKFGVFDRAAGKMVWQIDNGTIHSAAFSPNGRTIVAGEWQNGLNLYDAADGKKLHSFVPAGNERIWQAMFRPDGTILYQSSYSGSGNAPPWTLSYTIVHWDPVARKEIRTISDSIKYENSNVWLWHCGPGFFMERYQRHGTNTITHATASYTDPITGKATPEIKLDPDESRFDLSPDGKALLVRLGTNSPRVIDTATGKTLLTLDGHKSLVTWAAFSPDGKLIATVTGTAQSKYDRGKVSGAIPKGPAELVVWDAKTGKAIARSEFPTTELDFVQVKFSPDSKFLVAHCRDGADGEERKLVAFGTVPFDAKGGTELNFPKDEELKPKPKVVTPKGPSVIADPLDKLIEGLAQSSKPAKDKIEYLFVALLGRFPTQTEQKRIGEKYTGTYNLPVLQAIVAEIVATPEFEAHIKSLERRKAKPAPVLEGYDFWPGTGRPNIVRPYGWPQVEGSPERPSSPEYPLGNPRTKPPVPILDPQKP